MKSRILVCVCGADGEKPRYYRVFTGTIFKLVFRKKRIRIRVTLGRVSTEQDTKMDHL